MSCNRRCPSLQDSESKRGKRDKNRYFREYRPWNKVAVDLVVKKVALANLYYV